MRFRGTFLTAVILLVVAPASCAFAQEFSVDANSIDVTARGAKAAAKKRIAKQRAGGQISVNASPRTDPSLGNERPEFGWSGSYGGIHAGGALGSAGRNGP